MFPERNWAFVEVFIVPSATHSTSGCVCRIAAGGTRLRDSWNTRAGSERGARRAMVRKRAAQQIALSRLSGSPPIVRASTTRLNVRPYPMNRPSSPLHQRIKNLLDLPRQAKASEVSDCVFDCLSDALNCQFVSPEKLPGASAGYRAAWLAPSGTRYEGHGSSEAEATLAAALSLISECEDAALLRGYVEPELAELEIRQRRRRPGKGHARGPVVTAGRLRRAGCAE